MSEQTIRFRCRLGWHAWTKWEQAEPVRLVATQIGVTKAIRYDQSRECTVCGKSEVESKTVDNYGYNEVDKGIT